MEEEVEMVSQGEGDWAQLPDNLVEEVSRRLPVVSVINMGFVCKPWRRVLAERIPVSRRQGLPWLLLTFHNQYKERPCFSIVQRNFWSLQIPDALGKYCWGSVEDWLIIAQDKRSTLEIYLYNPFSGSKIFLPAVPSGDRYIKMVLSASPDDPNCLFLLLGNFDQSIACWSPLLGGPSWRLRDDPGISFEDAVFCAGRFYFLTPDYNLQTLDARDLISAMKQPYNFCTSAIQLPLRLHQVAIPDRPASPSRSEMLRSYLVESCGEVVMASRLFRDLGGSRRETHGFELFKLLDSPSKKMVWNKMAHGLGDRVLFLGKFNSRSFSAKDLGPHLANRIFFFNDLCTFGVNEWDKRLLDTFTPPISCSTFMDWGSFSMDTKCFIPNGSNSGSPHTYPPIWITAPIWWFFTLSSTDKHQRIDVAMRTGKSVKRTAQQEKKKKNKARPHDKRRKIATSYRSRYNLKLVQPEKLQQRGYTGMLWDDVRICNNQIPVIWMMQSNAGSSMHDLLSIFI